MMATRLTDSELAQRVRAGNQRRAARQLERRRSAGLVQLNVWVSQSTRTALDRAAAHRNMTVSETVSDLLERALSAAMLLNATTTRDKPTSAELFDAPAGNDTTTTRDALMMEVGKLLDEGHSGAEVARRLTAAGYRSPTGAALTGANLLRDYRRWQAVRGRETPPAQDTNK